ncbi:hypothetical protein P4S72_06195 [Vibrio sp. PP-XX7]
MLTKDVSQELTSIITQLTDEGKEPTVALVKSRLTTKVPIPAIITTIKSWKSSQRIPKVEVAMAADSSAPDTTRIARLEQQVIELTERLNALESNWKQSS